MIRDAARKSGWSSGRPNLMEFPDKRVVMQISHKRSSLRHDQRTEIQNEAPDVRETRRRRDLRDFRCKLLYYYAALVCMKINESDKRLAD